MNGDLRWMVAGSGRLTLVLVAAIGLVVRVAVLRRLQRFETTARLIAGGDLDRRVPAEGVDTISWLAREFNTMADSMTGLVGEVRDQRERLETVINSIDDGIVVLDANRRGDRGQRRLPAAGAAGRAQEVLGCCAARGATGMCGVADCPTLACLQSGERQVRICERRAAGRRRRVGGGARLADPRRGRAAGCTWSRCGATSPSGGRRRRGWPSRTGWRRWGCSRRASRTS